MSQKNKNKSECILKYFSPILTIFQVLGIAACTINYKTFHINTISYYGVYGFIASLLLCIAFYYQLLIWTSVTSDEDDEALLSDNFQTLLKYFLLAMIIVTIFVSWLTRYELIKMFNCFNKLDILFKKYEISFKYQIIKLAGYAMIGYVIFEMVITGYGYFIRTNSISFALINVLLESIIEFSFCQHILYLTVIYLSIHECNLYFDKISKNLDDDEQEIILKNSCTLFQNIFTTCLCFQNCGSFITFLNITYDFILLIGKTFFLYENYLQGDYVSMVRILPYIWRGIFNNTAYLQICSMIYKEVKFKNMVFPLDQFSSIQFGFRFLS